MSSAFPLKERALPMSEKKALRRKAFRAKKSADPCIEISVLFWWRILYIVLYIAGFYSSDFQ